jgi:hypothetical protein
MTITRSMGPADGPALVKRALQDLTAGNAGMAAWVAGGAAAAGVSQPIQRFMLKLSDLTGPDVLSKAVPIGWRYLVVGQAPGAAAEAAEPMAVADVKDTQSGTATFDSLIYGKIAERLTKAAEFAAEKYNTAQDDFEVRILEIPSVYMTALWLHGARDIFIPFLEGGSKDTQPLQEDPLFLSRAAQAAALKKVQSFSQGTR